MESCKLKIILHCAKGLVDVKHLGTMDPYAVFSILELPNNTKRTEVAKHGATDPVWDCPIAFDIIPMQKNYTLFCEIKHGGKLFDRNIGEVKLSFQDLLAVGDGCGERISYPVTSLSFGEIKGEIILSYKFLKIDSCDKKEGNGDDDVSTNEVVGTHQKQVEKKKGKMLKRFAGELGMKIVVGTAATGVLSALHLNGSGPLSQPDENDPQGKDDHDQEEDDDDFDIDM